MIVNQFKQHQAADLLSETSILHGGNTALSSTLPLERSLHFTLVPPPLAAGMCSGVQALI